MDRRLLFFPAAATVCWAQQTAPAAEEAKQALIGRVQAYYQLMVEKKYRQAESMVAAASKDDYYNRNKPDIRGFDVANIVFGDDLTTATVTVKSKVLTLMPGAGPVIFEMPSQSFWKLESGQWCWYIPEGLTNVTPFGTLQTGETAAAQMRDEKGKAPEMGTLLGQVSIDKDRVTLTADAAEQKVTIKNGLPGPLELKMDPHAENIGGLKVSLDKAQLNSGEKATISIHWDGSTKVTDVVRITAAPLNRVFAIAVSAN